MCWCPGPSHTYPPTHTPTHTPIQPPMHPPTHPPTHSHTHMRTGLANPGPIIAQLWTDEELEAAVTLDGVVTLVDARNVARQLAEPRPGGAPNEAQLQVALADVILLNKVCGARGLREGTPPTAALHCRACGTWLVPVCSGRARRGRAPLRAAGLGCRTAACGGACARGLRGLAQLPCGAAAETPACAHGPWCGVRGPCCPRAPPLCVGSCS